MLYRRRVRWDGLGLGCEVEDALTLSDTCVWVTRGEREEEESECGKVDLLLNKYK